MSFLRRSFAARSEAYVCMIFWMYVKKNIPTDRAIKSRMTVFILKVHFVYASMALDIIFGTTRFNPLLRIVKIRTPVIKKEYGFRRSSREFLFFNSTFSMGDQVLSYNFLRRKPLELELYVNLARCKMITQWKSFSRNSSLERTVYEKLRTSTRYGFLHKSYNIQLYLKRKYCANYQRNTKENRKPSEKDWVPPCAGPFLCTTLVLSNSRTHRYKQKRA